MSQSGSDGDPWPAPGTAQLAPGVDHEGWLPEGFVPDRDRFIVCVDVDAFYCQVEELRDPSLATRPMGVSQKYLVVTANYLARAAGVEKLMNTKEAQKRCPGLVLVPGEDLTPYRAAARKVRRVLSRFGPCQAGGLDEVFVDVTAEVLRRCRAEDPGATFVGHVYRHRRADASGGLLQGPRHRPMDVRAAPAHTEGSADVHPPPPLSALSDDGQGWVRGLAAASRVAAEARAAVRAECGLRTSAGIACNRMLAKLASGLHKPDGQTTLPPSEASRFVAELPARALPGVGSRAAKCLYAIGVTSVADIRRAGVDAVAAALAAGPPRLDPGQSDTPSPPPKPGVASGTTPPRFLAQANQIFRMSCGADDTPVEPRPPAKAVSVEDSFKSCETFQGVESVLSVLCPDMVSRIDEEREETGRVPRTLTVKWRLRGRGQKRTSASTAMPATVVDCTVALGERATRLAAAAGGVLRTGLRDSGDFCLTLINLAATGFVASGDCAGKRSAPMPVEGGDVAKRARGDGSAMRSLQARRDYGTGTGAGGALSKRAERALVEGGVGEESGEGCWEDGGVWMVDGGGEVLPGYMSSGGSSEEWDRVRRG
ncbi:unnamed protein product [Pedinophyceae sp. YPF-701]|nr:unnamed protein product [Pedinophyceae sp. YPF-701]